MRICTEWILAIHINDVALYKKYNSNFVFIRRRLKFDYIILPHIQDNIMIFVCTCGYISHKVIYVYVEKAEKMHDIMLFLNVSYDIIYYVSAWECLL